MYLHAQGVVCVTNTKFLIFALILGVGTAALVVPQIGNAVAHFGETPSALFWLGLAVVVTVLPVRGMAGVGALNISPLPLFTLLLLHGGAAGVVAAWLTGLAATLSSRTGNAKTDAIRALLNSSKHALCILAAAYILWGNDLGTGALSFGLGRSVLLRVLFAHAAYFSTSSLILAFGLWLRDGTNPLQVWRANFGYGALVSWSTPLGAYLLALFYLQGGFLLIAILVGTGLIGILTVRDHVRIRSSFIRLVDALRLARDGNMPHLKGETHRVLELALRIGNKMHLPYRNMQLLEKAAMLHNVGYISVDRDTVLKPSLLSDRELHEIREHPDSGTRILREVVGMSSVADIVRSHHESPDGSGYPLGLKGSEIPIEGAIIKVAESFIAMTSPRPHRHKVMSNGQALEEIARVAGQSLDASVAYFLFDMMGRPDLASRVSKGFGPPGRHHIKPRLYKPRSKPLKVLPRKRKDRRSMIMGSVLIGAMAVILVLLTKSGISLGFVASPSPITTGTTASLFFLFLLGLASLKPVRLPWGAYVSSSSAIVLVMSLMGGPVYAVLFGFALIGWAMLLDPATAMTSTMMSMNVAGGYTNGNGSGRHAARKKSDRHADDGGITSLIKAKALGSRLSTASAYGFVVMLAGSASWVMYNLGHRASDALNLGGTPAELAPFLMSVASFYLLETMLQATLLAKNGLSASRLWQRNYLKIFPEPLTYAVCGYAIMLGNNLLGLWAAIPLFLFPTLWRHLALLRRLELLKTKDSLIRAIARAVDEKDRYTGGHSASVVEIGVAIAREMGKSEPFVERLEEAAIRHDLGKVSWPNQVLRKPARLVGEEEQYKWTHPDVSAEIATRAGSTAEVAGMIRYHHERYDGKGYPDGLKGDLIPLGARILCVADSFDAMIHDRWYKRKRTIQGAVDEIVRCSGTQFDPLVVEAFLRILKKMDLEKLIEAVEDVVGEIKEEEEAEVVAT
jgi:HD-GYP domain-containing protein (c-di-GMP phosphodiesterase class II)